MGTCLFWCLIFKGKYKIKANFSKNNIIIFHYFVLYLQYENII